MIVLAFTILGIIIPLIWVFYQSWKLDKPFRDWYNRNIPKNSTHRTYEDYITYLDNYGKEDI